MRIDRNKDGIYTVAYFETFDDGSEDFLDVYEFETVDPDLEYGLKDSFQTYDEALEFSRQRYHCNNEKYVTAGMIQEEYRLYLLSRGSQRNA